MELSEMMQRDGLKFIVGEWQVDYVVNAFSNDLAHIPAAKFKSDDGRDFSAIHYTFREDHTLTLSDISTGKTEEGTWEQTDIGQYHYTVGAFYNVPDDLFKKNVETLVRQGDVIVFSMGFLAIALKKIAEGEVTPIIQAADAKPTEADAGLNAIVGTYVTEKCLIFVGEGPSLMNREDAAFTLKKEVEEGRIEEDEIREYMRFFDSRYDVTEDHKIITWMKIPEEATEEEIKKAIESGMFTEVKDGYFACEETTWKAVDGVYYYDSGIEAEVMGEKLSPWKEFKAGDDGLINYAEGMLKLRRL